MKIPFLTRWMQHREINSFEKEIERNKVLAELEAFCAIGDRFYYLGITMVCTAYGWGESYLGWVDGIVADYVNDEGEVMEHRFHFCDLHTLEKENARGELYINGIYDSEEGYEH